jgi:hypothetical protein
MTASVTRRAAASLLGAAAWSVADEVKAGDSAPEIKIAIDGDYIIFLKSGILMKTSFGRRKWKEGLFSSMALSSAS